MNTVTTRTFPTEFTREDTSVSWTQSEVAFSMGVMRLPVFSASVFTDQVEMMIEQFNSSEQRNALTYLGGNQ